MKDFYTFTNIIGGQPRLGNNKCRGVDPSTKKPLWDVPVASEQDLEDAVASARESFASWSRSSWEHRRQQLLLARETLLANKGQMAELITKEGGKPVSTKPKEVLDLALTVFSDSVCAP